MDPVTVNAYRAAARRRLPRLIFDYVDGGANDERTLAANVADFAAVTLRQRVMVDCSGPELSTQLFGQTLSMPLLLAPIGMGGMLARRGEVQAARAAEAEGVPFCQSTMSVCSLKEVADAVKAPPWFQLYMVKDRGRMAAMLDQAQALGAPPLIFTVDLPIGGLRHRDVRSGFSSEPSLGRSLQRMIDGVTHPQWVWDLFVNGQPHSLGNFQGVQTDGKGLAGYWNWIRDNFDPATQWSDLAWVRDHWKGPIILKGVLDPEDAELAVQHGADGIIVSNHGGRQLDSVTSGIAALPRVAERVDGRMAVLMDGGVRSGLDILKAVALGADACLIGRAWAYALAAQGETGVRNMLQTLRKELTIAMALTGCKDIAKADRSLLEE